jgi:hypothetical protein
MRIVAATNKANKKAKIFFCCSLAFFVLVVGIVIAAPSEKAPAKQDHKSTHQHKAAVHPSEEFTAEQKLYCLQHPYTIACAGSGADRADEEALRRSSREAAEGK